MDEQRSSEAMQQCDVVELVERTIDRFSASDCEISLSHDEHAVIAGSEDQIERAVLNLLENAALHAESKVRVEVEQVGTSVRVAVEDDGPGIALEDRERVFDRFVRLDESRSRTTGGTGIGLSIVLAVATRHHGSVVVEESPELGGARFVMTLN